MHVSILIAAKLAGPHVTVSVTGEVTLRGQKKGGRGMSFFFFETPSSPNRILREVYVQTNCLCAHLKVCHSSAFQTISARQIIINHSDSVLAKNLFHISKMYATIKLSTLY